MDVLIVIVDYGNHHNGWDLPWEMRQFPYSMSVARLWRRLLELHWGHWELSPSEL